GLCPRCYAAFHRAKQKTGIDRSTWLARTRKGGVPKSENSPDEVSTPKGGRPKSENLPDELSTPKGGRPKSENPYVGYSKTPIPPNPVFRFHFEEFPRYRVHVLLNRSY